MRHTFGSRPYGSGEPPPASGPPCAPIRGDRVSVWGFPDPAWRARARVFGGASESLTNL
jgi:hypothetical protein